MTSEVIEDEEQFYSKAKMYWKQIPPTVDGMLGGYGRISSIDINSSRKFLQRFLRVGRSGVLSRRGCGSGGPLAISWYLPQGLEELGWVGTL
uniref:N-terminal Xaa-Pro-Lys N-methyltransferase 1 n=1 Tax=Saimiri boliviensis boliviensis TaxID=39432 RepID=A0A2K6SAL9_SAIBB